MADLFGQSRVELPFHLPSSGEYGAIWNEKWTGFDVRIPGGQFLYSEHFFRPKLSDRVVEYFQENDSVDWRLVDWQTLAPEVLNEICFKNIRWKQDWISMYGKRMPLPRLTAWYGDSGKAYTYSGITSRPNAWNDGLLHVKQLVEECAGIEFNSVLLNWYRDGSDHLSWHSDDEKELGANPVIASASFGETRDFVIRRKQNHSEKIKLPLKHGSLLVMKGEFQHHWQHYVPKRKDTKSSRFNLTFRRIGL
jgi:alkylated DNA repair dioxygenase AlkB